MHIVRYGFALFGFGFILWHFYITAISSWMLFIAFKLATELLFFLRFRILLCNNAPHFVSQFLDIFLRLPFFFDGFFNFIAHPAKCPNVSMHWKS